MLRWGKAWRRPGGVAPPIFESETPWTWMQAEAQDGTLLGEVWLLGAAVPGAERTTKAALKPLWDAPQTPAAGRKGDPGGASAVGPGGRSCCPEERGGVAPRGRHSGRPQRSNSASCRRHRCPRDDGRPRRRRGVPRGATLSTEAILEHARLLGAVGVRADDATRSATREARGDKPRAVPPRSAGWVLAARKRNSPVGCRRTRSRHPTWPARVFARGARRLGRAGHVPKSRSPTRRRGPVPPRRGLPRRGESGPRRCREGTGSTEEGRRRR